MTGLTDLWVIPCLMVLADWSVRWGVLLGALAAWFAVRPPRRAATRHRLCAAALAAGLLLPVAPRWGEATVSAPFPPPSTVGTASAPTIVAVLPFPNVPDGRADSREGSAGRFERVEFLVAARPPRALVRSRPLGAWRLAALAAAGVWASGALVALARLAGGWLLLARLRRRARPIGDRAEHTFEECRRALGLRRPAALAAHPDVGSPVTLGGRRPLVLVPSDWSDWPEPYRRACLLHELAHLARSDDWAKLAQELVRVPFGFHPLVRWLAARLDRERELLCDEAVVALGADPVAYARLLLDLARRPGRLRLDSPFSRPGWLPFLDRRTVVVRIERLLEDDMPRTLSRSSPTRSLLIAALALTAGLGIGGLHVRAVSAQPAVDRVKPSAEPEKSAGPGGRREPPRALRNETAKTPVANDADKGVAGPRDVAPDELIGVVVDTDGKPVEGVEVDAWTWHPGHEAKTDARGAFRIGKLDEHRKVEVVVRKPGYTPRLFLQQPTGTPGWVIVLGNKTYFEGNVTGPDGKPVPGARIRANNGPKRGDGVMIAEIWTEATTGPDGRYRMYAQSDVYDIQVRVPGVGVARLPGTPLADDEAKRLDIRLKPGVTFRARVVDSLTGAPVPGVRLWHWQHPGVEGRSGADGVVSIPDMMPGRFQFQVEPLGVRPVVVGRGGHRVEPPPDRRGPRGLAAELRHHRLRPQDRHGARHRDGRAGREGHRPRARSRRQTCGWGHRRPGPDGQGTSLTGDTRFSVATDKDGRFTVWLPASGDRDYNLVAHDGKYGEWRTWANGVLPPFRTKPGQTVDGVVLRLTRPATVRGRMLDAKGKPVAGREVRASAADRWENRYYDPTTRTGLDGSYELKFIRPGEHHIQIAPFWLDAREAPEGTSRTITLGAGEVKDGVGFQVVPDAAR